MRFISNLLPLLRTATTTAPHLSRTLSVLGPGHEGKINLDDLDLKNTFSGTRCASHTIVMNDLMVGEFAARETGTSFLHSAPGIVVTGVARELPFWARAVIKVMTPVMHLVSVSHEETGQRQLFHVTSGVYPPAKPTDEAPLATGIPLAGGSTVASGYDGKIGSGGYLVDWNGEITGNTQILSDYRQKGVAKTVWEHTMDTFKKVEEIDRGNAKNPTS